MIGICNGAKYQETKYFVKENIFFLSISAEKPFFPEQNLRDNSHFIRDVE